MFSEYKTFRLIAWAVSLICTVVVVQASLVQASPYNQDQGIAVINSPTSDEVIRGQVQIVGSADHPNSAYFAYYAIDIDPAGTQSWQFLADGRNRVINGNLATWNTALFPDGNYDIQLRVVWVDGNFGRDVIQSVAVSNTAPLPTATPLATATTINFATLLPEISTNTPLPPTETPRVIIEGPIVDTPTPRPTATSTPTLVGPTLVAPDSGSSIIPSVDVIPWAALRNAFMYGCGLMLVIFLFFGFLSALRMVFKGFVQRQSRF